MTSSLTLVSAMGNVDLILEFMDFFNGGDRFTYSGEAAEVRQRFAGSRLTEVYLFCTRQVQNHFASLCRQAGRDYPEVRLRPVDLPFDDITSRDDEEKMRSLVYSTVEKLAGSDKRVIISSGGRKTMTNRLIEAGLLYGCEGYLAITAPHVEKEKIKEIRTMSAEFNVLWIPARRFYQQRQQVSVRDGLGDSFRSLYVLPHAVVSKLQEQRIGRDISTGDNDLAWLRRLPKADLHCHLGGAFDPRLLQELARNMIEELPLDREAIARKLEGRLGCSLRDLDADRLRALDAAAVHCLRNLKHLASDDPAHEIIPVLISGLGEKQVLDLCYDGRDISKVHNMDLEWYMTCGDLGGSALLQTETNLRKALAWLLQTSYGDGVRYLEVRCSPGNYTKCGLSLLRVMEVLLAEGSGFMRWHPDFRVNFLIMATRHKSRAAMSAHVAAAVTLVTSADSDPENGPAARVTGFDLAGQERDFDPMLFQDSLLPLHHHFINITIHAGEMEEDDKIWQALYLLHAKRIGHGLKLVNNPKMMDYVRDYGTAIEMCPSSNIQTNDFAVPGRGKSSGPVYPLKKYMDHGITVTLNTDNPGISATTLSREYHRAALMTENGLSRWQILKLVRNGFKAAFLPRNEKDRMLKEIDSCVFSLVLDEYFPMEEPC